MNATIDKINNLQTDLDEAREKYLTKRGWRKSSNYPDSRWRWHSGEYVGVSLDCAISIQSHLDDGYQRKSPIIKK